jgi:predicted DCC family thiol-disulfide oxidoreductase YuxK
VEFGLNPTTLHSIIAVDSGKFYERSDAALKIATHLPQPWPMLRICRIFPRAFCDWVYDLIAKNRYRMFGKRESCMLPTPEMKAKFVG